MHLGAPEVVDEEKPRLMDLEVDEYLRSHILIVPSSLPVTSHFPSLWKETEVTFMV